MGFGSFGDGGLEAFNLNADYIEKVLGELKGLENAMDYYHRDDTLGMIGSDVNWHVPSETQPFLIVVAVNDNDRGYEEAVAHVQSQFQVCWDLGKSWASGIADEIKRYGKFYGDVDVKKLKQLADDLEIQAQRLNGALTSNDTDGDGQPDGNGNVSPNFSVNANRGTDLEKTLGNFQGEFAGQLHGFYSNVGYHVNNWAVVASSVAAGYAGTALLIDQCQKDMIEWVIKTRRHCEAQLKNWKDSYGFGILHMQNGSPGIDIAQTVVTLTNIVSFGSSVAGLFPAAKPVAGTVGTVSGIVNKVFSLIDTAPEQPVTFNAERALDIWGWEDSGSGAKHELGHTIVDGCTQGLYELRDRGGSDNPSGTADVAAAVEARASTANGGWFAPRPQGIADPDPSDLWYNL